MASLINHCTRSFTKMTFYRVLLQLPYLLGFKGPFKINIKFYGRKLEFIVPVQYLNAILNNAEHVLTSCDYYRFTRALPKPGDIVVDVGAFIGFYTISSAVMAGSNSFVHALEPNPEIVGYLAKNIEINNLKKSTRCYNIAVCPSTGKTKLYIGKYPSVSSLVREHVEEYTSIVRVVEVKCVKLSSLLKYLGFADILKLDIEGLERDTLSEAREELKLVDRLIVEVHEPEVSPVEVEEILRNAGFRIVLLHASHENPRQVVVYAFK